MSTDTKRAATTERTSARPLPPGQHARRDFPRFGTHLHLPAPAVPAEPVIEVVGMDDGLVVPLAQLDELPRREQTSDLHCVSGWSAVGLRWEGVPFRAFYETIAAPLSAGQTVTHLVLEGLDGYRVAVCLEDALADDVLLADHLNGAPLDSDHGAPVRFVSPGQYGYASAKHLARIELWTQEPPENFSWVHWLGWAVMRPPLFWRHPRSRVWHEERNRHLPAWLMRIVYAPLRAPIRWLSGQGSGQRRRSTGRG
jgi:DMSO/TMAO reductase YedYZ molybdopterin-dependent catalytic subunit